MEALNSNLFKFKVASEAEATGSEDYSGSEGSEFDIMSELPVDVARRVYALEHLQEKRALIEEDFRKELALLEKKYEDLYNPLYEDRARIINGEREATPEEYEGREESSVSLVDAPKTVGIPGFWLGVMERSQLSGLIFENDHPVLQHLRDIKTERIIDPEAPKLVVSFVFGPNDYFTNAVLSKTVVFNAQGNGVTEIIGTPIEWKEGKNLCWSVENKKVRHRTKPGVFSTKEVRTEEQSFFHFFAEVAASGCGEDDDHDHDHDHDGDDSRMMADAEICSFLDRYIVPAAVDWFTGKAMDEEDDEDYDEEEFDSELEEDDEESDY